MPPSTPLSPRRHHPDCLHTVTAPGFRTVYSAFTAMLGHRAILLLLHRRDHTAASLTTSTTVAITAAAGNRTVHSAVTATMSTPTDCHHLAWEPCHPPGRHRRLVHTSLTSSTCRSLANFLPLSFPLPL
jgi:hypothetical protein